MFEQAVETGVSANHDCCPGTEVDEGGADANICIQHCTYGHASVDSVQPLPVALNGEMSGLRVEPARPTAIGDSRPERRYATGLTWPPVAILFGVLRI